VLLWAENIEYEQGDESKHPQKVKEREWEEEGGHPQETKRFGYQPGYQVTTSKHPFKASLYI